MQWPKDNDLRNTTPEHWCLQTFSEDGQTMQWPKENDLQNTPQNTDVFKLLVQDIQCNVQKTMIYETLLRTLVSSNF